MQNLKVHIFCKGHYAEKQLILWLKKFGYSLAEKDASTFKREDIIFIDEDIKKHPDTAFTKNIIYIGRKKPEDKQGFFLKKPIAPRALFHLLRHLDQAEKIFEYSPGIPGDLIDFSLWLNTLSEKRAETILPEIFQYLDSERKEPAFSSLLEEKSRELLNYKKELILLGLEQGGANTKLICARSFTEELADKKALELILKLLDQDLSSAEKEALTLILGLFKFKKARETLYKTALNNELISSLAAIEAIGLGAKNRDIFFLSRIIKKSEPIKAVNAANTLAGIKKKKAYQALCENLYPEDILVRKTISKLLIKGKEKALPFLIRKLKEKGVNERISACMILGEIGNEKALKALDKQIKQKDSELRFYACEAIGKLDTDKNLNSLVKALEDKNQKVICAAVNGLNIRYPREGAKEIARLISLNSETREDLIAAIVAMQASDIFLNLSLNEKIARKIVETASQIQSPKLLHNFLRASKEIKKESLSLELQLKLEKSLKDIKTSRKKILIVDSSHTMRRFYEALISRLAYATETARDGQDALNRLESKAEEFSLILSELNMPNKNGLELTKELRKKLNQIPVLIIKEKNTRLEETLIKAGANDTIEKPFSIKSLGKALNKLIER